MTPYDTAAALVIDMEREALQDHIANLDEMDNTLIELGGTMESVWARLSAAKEME